MHSIYQSSMQAVLIDYLQTHLQFSEGNASPGSNHLVAVLKKLDEELHCLEKGERRGEGGR